MKLNVKQLSGDQFFVEIEASDLVFALKSKIEEITSIARNKQRLIFSAIELVDNAKISDYSNLVDGKTIHMVIRRTININIDIGIEPQTETTLSQPLTQPINHMVNDNDNDNDLLNEEGLPMSDVMEMSRSCRLIKIFALIDCALMIVFAIYNQFFLIGIPLAICGFIGARRLQRVPLV
eukprot:UN05072